MSLTHSLSRSDGVKVHAAYAASQHDKDIPKNRPSLNLFDDEKGKKNYSLRHDSLVVAVLKLERGTIFLETA